MSLNNCKENSVIIKDIMEENKIIKPNLNFISKIFVNYDKIDYNKLMFTQDSIYSSSRIRGTKKLIQIILNHTKNDKDLIITDGTANIGTDTINLTNYFNKVNAIEISDINFRALENNVDVFQLRNKIKTFHGDTNNLIKLLDQDVIYIDAPWGGPKYKESSKIKLYLGDIEILDFYLENINRAKVFIFKVPNNYDFDYLKSKINNKTTIYNYVKGNTTKYNLIVIEKIEKN